MFSRALSHSSMGLYKECPQRFKFRYIDGIREEPKSYFSFGQSVHKALEFFYRSQLLPPSLGDVLAFYKTNWVKEGYKTPQDEKKNFEEGVRIITAFHKKHIGDWKPPLATEYDFNVTIDGVAVCGKIDRIDKLPSGSLHVIDYKTGKAFSPDKAVQDEQLTLYQIACEESLGAPVEKLTLYHLPSLTPMDSPRHPDTLTRNLRTNILSVKTSIDAGKYDPKPDDWKCRWCDYKKICPAWNKDEVSGRGGERVTKKIIKKEMEKPAWPDPLLGTATADASPSEKTPIRKTIQSHEELDIYKIAFQLSMKIFEISKTFPVEERYSLTDQIRRSSRSVCANIAEAWRKRRYAAAFVSKLNDSESEAAETQTWIKFSLSCKYMDSNVAADLIQQYDHVIGKLVRMITSSQDWTL